MYRGVFMKNKKNDKKKNEKKIIDLRRFMESEAVMRDENGSYTGMPAEYYYDGVMNEPVQDSDDL